MYSLIRQRLREGVETQPAFDRRSRALYILLCTECLAGAASSKASGFTYDLPFEKAAWGCLLIGCALLLRRIGHKKVAGGIETSILSFLHGFPTIFIIFPLLAISGPFADSWLGHTDEMLGFDWFALIHFFARHQQGLELALRAYQSIFWQPLLIIPALWIFNRGDRAWMMVTALSFSLAISLAIYPFAPADAAFTHYGVTPAQYPLQSTIPWTTGPVVHSIKDGARHVTLDSLKGLVTFPSYHAAIAVILTWAAWPIRGFGYLIAILNAVVLVSCILVGAHYLVDVIAGSVIAIASVVLSEKVLSSRGGRPMNV
jgi:membrane-associated phospholipid phosphatase